MIIAYGYLAIAVCVFFVGLYYILKESDYTVGRWFSICFLVFESLLWFPIAILLIIQYIIDKSYDKRSD